MSAFFLATNGLLYRDPLLRGRGYFIVFDGQDETELVIAKNAAEPPLDGTQARLRAVSILEQSGLSAVISGPPRQMLRAFDTAGDDARDSYCFWLDVGEPIPAALIEPEALAAGVVEPPGEAVVCSFGQPWGEPPAV